MLKMNCVCCVVTERDVSRTDRHNTFFSGNDNPGLTLLHDVLITNCMYNFDLGETPPPKKKKINVKIKIFCGLRVTFRS